MMMRQRSEGKKFLDWNGMECESESVSESKIQEEKKLNLTSDWIGLRG